MNKLSTNLAEVHNSIIDAVTRHWQAQENQLQTIAAYDPVKGAAVDSPALLLSVNNMSQAPQVRPGHTGITLDLSLHCILSNRTQGHGVQVEIRQFAAEVMRLVELKGQTHWGLGAAATDIGNLSAQPAEFNPEKNGFESWEISWSQTFYMGDEESPPQPLPATHYGSVAPYIGKAYKDEYQQLNESPDE